MGGARANHPLFLLLLFDSCVVTRPTTTRCLTHTTPSILNRESAAAAATTTTAPPPSSSVRLSSVWLSSVAGGGLQTGRLPINWLTLIDACLALPLPLPAVTVGVGVGVGGHQTKTFFLNNFERWITRLARR